MKVVTVTKAGSLVDPDPDKRGVIEVIDTPLKPIGDDDLLIKVAYCAICGSDPHAIESNLFRNPPFGLGHELSGVVVEVGKNALKNGFKIGDRVGGNFKNFCGSCYYCTNGMQQFCRNSASGPGMAEYIVWNERQAVKIPDSVSLKNGCMIEPISIAVRAMDKADIKFGQNVLVAGGGPIGLLILQAVKMFGAANLTLFEPNPARRELALKYGAKYVFDPVTQDVKAETDKITDGRGFDVLFEVSGVPSSAEMMLDISSRYSHLIYVAQYDREYKMPLPLYNQLYSKETTITGIVISPYTFTRAAQMIERFDLDDMTAQVYDIDDAAEAFQAHMTGKYPKVLIKCNPDLE